jgi:hypothetical protein
MNKVLLTICFLLAFLSAIYGHDVTLANTYSNSLATAISSIGSTPTTLLIRTRR